MVRPFFLDKRGGRQGLLKRENSHLPQSPPPPVPARGNVRSNSISHGHKVEATLPVPSHDWAIDIRRPSEECKKRVLGKSAQGRQKQPSKQKHPQEIGTAKREPGSSRPEQAVLISHQPPPTAPREGSNRSRAPPLQKINPQPLGTSVCPRRDQSNSSRLTLHPQPTPPFSVSA